MRRVGANLRQGALEVTHPAAGAAAATPESAGLERRNASRKIACHFCLQYQPTLLCRNFTFTCRPGLCPQPLSCDAGKSVHNPAFEIHEPSCQPPF